MGAMAAAAAGAAGGGGLAGAGQAVLQHKLQNKAQRGNPMAQAYLRRDEAGTQPAQPVSRTPELFGAGANPMQSTLQRFGQSQGLKPEQQGAGAQLIQSLYR